MKKTALFMAVLAMAVSANAASIDWTISGPPPMTANDYLGNPAANATIYFIVANDLSSITSITQFKADFLSNLSAITLTTAQMTETGAKPAINQQPVSSPLLTAGTPTTFGMLYFSEDAAGNGYYKIAVSGSTPYLDGAPAYDQTEVVTSFPTMASAGWTQGYVPVPEPATAALALAGLALLIRRRK